MSSPTSRAYRRFSAHRGLSARQHNLLNYLADLNDAFDERDYTVYGEDAQLIRNADIRFMEKVGRAFDNDEDIWQKGDN